MSYITYFDGASDSFGFTAGQTVAGSLVYDTNTPPASFSDPSSPTFANSITSMTFGNIAIVPSPPAFNNGTQYSTFQVIPNQAISAYGYSTYDAPAGSPYATVINVGQFTLTPSAGTNPIPTPDVDWATLSMSSFSTEASTFTFERSLYYSDGSQQITQIVINIDGLQVTDNPEPATWMLAVCGAAVCMVYAYYRRFRTAADGFPRTTVAPAVG